MIHASVYHVGLIRILMLEQAVLSALSCYVPVAFVLSYVLHFLNPHARILEHFITDQIQQSHSPC